MMDDRLPPYSEEAERSVLGAIMLDYRAFNAAVDYKLEADAFYVPAHRKLFEALEKLIARDTFVDVVTVTNFMSGDEAFQQMGGSAFLDRLIDSTPTAAHAEYYIEIVAEKWKKRSVIQECRDTEQRCYEDDEAEVIVTDHQAGLTKIEARHMQDEVPWSKTVADSMNKLVDIVEGGSQLAGYSTGFRNLDRAVLGLKETELTILAARPAQGKTSLAMNIAEYVAAGKIDANREQRPVGIFSLEMGRDQLALRMKCSNANVNSWQLLRGAISQQNMQRLVTAAANLSTLPLVVDDRAGLDIEQIRIKARRWKEKRDIQLLVVDYLQLIQCHKRAKQSRQLEVSAISSTLKEIAKELSIPVLALSQLSRKPEDRADGRPLLSDLRESGSIEQDADNVWLLHRPCKYPKHPEVEDKSLAIVEVAKHRSGPTGEVRLNFREEVTRFEDREEVDQEEMAL
ncbi:MAG: replicative DNA helicase [Planctomycetota bacterium]|jgi:replicative DNA helicase